MKLGNLFLFVLCVCCVLLLVYIFITWKHSYSFFEVLCLGVAGYELIKTAIKAGNDLK